MQYHTIPRRRFLTAVAVGGVTIGATSAVAARPAQRNFRAHLAGENEVPAVETKARGQTVFRVGGDGDELHYRLIAANIEDVLMAHIHLGGVDENGPVVAWLYPEGGPPPELIPGRFDGVLAQAAITADDLAGPLAGGSFDDLLDAIRTGNTYVNVHTEANPGGEIRGQIR